MVWWINYSHCYPGIKGLIPGFTSLYDAFFIKRWTRLHITLAVWWHARIKKVLSEGVQHWHRFFYERRKDPNTTISGPSTADDGPAFDAGLVALSGPVLLRNTIFCVIFQGGPAPLPPPPL